MPQTTIIIYADDDFERLADAKAEVGRAERALEAEAEKADQGGARFGDTKPEAVTDAEANVRSAKEAFNAALDRACSRADEWELHSIGFEAWRDLLAKHPARKVTEGEGDDAKEITHPDDAAWGLALSCKPFNVETFGKALLLFVDPEDPEHRTVTKLGGAEVGTVLLKRLRRLAEGQFVELWVAAHQLNTGGVADPKALRYSIAPRLSES